MENLSTIIMALILVVIVVLAVRSSRKHLKGEGGCCGGSGGSEPVPKKLEGPAIKKLEIGIEGMHCDNCKNSIERKINEIEGAVAKVNVRNNNAIVSMDREIADEKFVKAIEKLDFKVTEVKTI